MSISNLSDIGQFLVGNTNEQPGWLQNVYSSASPLGDFLVLGYHQRLVLLKSKYTQGTKTMVQSYQGEVSVLDESETITSLITFPVIVGGRGATSSWNCTVCGFNSGQVRVYNETGKLLVQKSFHTSAVKHVKVQAMPEGKHYTNVLHSQTIQELIIVYESMIVTISGSDLYQTLKDNLAHLALATAQGLQFSQLTSLPGLKLLVEEQSVTDCESFVQQNTSYSQYLTITMKGGLVDERLKPVHTSPLFISCGANPFLQYQDRSLQVNTNPVALVQNMATTVKSGFYRLWGGGGKEETSQPKSDPEANLSICFSIKDEGRAGNEVFLSPNKVYTAIRDEKNRVMVLDNINGTVVQAWRGYHRCQVAWAVTSWGDKDIEFEPGTDVQVSVILLLYLPRRGLIEIWSPEQKNKVTEFHVSKHGLLLKSCLACLDDGIPRKKEVLTLHCAFLQPNGVINRFFIPFHALTTSSSAERDFQLQSDLKDHLMKTKIENEFLVKKISEIKNAQLRGQILSDIVTTENRMTPSQISEFLQLVHESLLKTEEQNTSIENKLFKSKVCKLRLLCRLYEDFLRNNEKVYDNDVSKNLEEELCLELFTDLEEVRSILSVLDITEEKDGAFPSIAFAEFISCFEVEGDLKTPKGETVIKLKKHIPPELAFNLNSCIASLVYSDSPSAIDHFRNCGFYIEDLVQLLLTAKIYKMEFSLANIKRTFRLMNFLLNLNANIDDRHRSTMQEQIRRVLRKQNMSSAVFLIAVIWKCVLVASNSQAVLVYAEDWSRKLHLLESFLKIRSTFEQMQEEGVITNPYTMAEVFECGNGRISEILARWLIKLGADSKSLMSSMECLEDNSVKLLVEKGATFFPSSCSLNILIIHMCWEHMQMWTRNRDNIDLLDTVIKSLWNIPCPTLRVKTISLIWRTFIVQLLRDCAKITESLAKSLTNKNNKCMEVLQMKADSVADWLSRISDLLECQLQTLTHTGDGLVVDIHYDNLATESQPHLLDHVLNCTLPDIEIVSLEQQVTLVLELTWTLKIHQRPLQLFNTAETTQILQTQSSLMSSFFSDPDTGVQKTRVVWLGIAMEASVGHIYLKLGEGKEYETDNFTRLSEKLMQLGRVWFMSDLVRICQVDSLYRAGYDDLASELRPTVTDTSALGDRLLEISLLRIAKYVWSGSTDSQGRLAAVPSALITQLADRKQASAGVADAGMVDTVELLAWATGTIQDTDRHNLATQALAAAQVLQVRNNRQNTTD